MTKAEEVKVTVRIIFGNRTSNESETVTVGLNSTGEETISQVKEKIANVIGGQLTGDDLLLKFGPNDRKIGRQYQGDPTVDENQIMMKEYSVLQWLERFPHWNISVTLLPLFQQLLELQ